PRAWRPGARGASALPNPPGEGTGTPGLLPTRRLREPRRLVNAPSVLAPHPSAGLDPTLPAGHGERAGGEGGPAAARGRSALEDYCQSWGTGSEPRTSMPSSGDGF